MADGRIHIEVGEEIRDSLLDGGRGQRLTERLDIEVAQEGQWRVPRGPPHTKPTAPLQGSLTGAAAGPSQGSNPEGEQSSIVRLPVALTLKVGREDSQAVLFPHPVPPSGRAARVFRTLGGGGQKGSFSLRWAHTGVPLEALGTPLPLPLQPPPTHSLRRATGGCFGPWTRPSGAPDKRGLSPFC